MASLASDVRVAGHGQGPVRGLDGDLRRIVVHAQDLCTTLSLQSRQRAVSRCARFAARMPADCSSQHVNETRALQPSKQSILASHLIVVWKTASGDILGVFSCGLRVCRGLDCRQSNCT